MLLIVIILGVFVIPEVITVVVVKVLGIVVVVDIVLILFGRCLFACGSLFACCSFASCAARRCVCSSRCVCSTVISCGGRSYGVCFVLFFLRRSTYIFDYYKKRTNYRNNYGNNKSFSVCLFSLLFLILGSVFFRLHFCKPSLDPFSLHIIRCFILKKGPVLYNIVHILMKQVSVLR